MKAKEKRRKKTRTSWEQPDDARERRLRTKEAETSWKLEARRVGIEGKERKRRRG